MTTALDKAAYAIDAIAKGKIILLSDHIGRENEADLVFAAEKVTEKTMIDLYQLTSTGGEICVPMTLKRLQELELQPNDDGRVIPPNRDPCKFYTRVDHKEGTGVSAFDRANTVRALVYDRFPLGHPESNLKNQGHTHPLCATIGGFSERQGHTEGSLALMELAGCKPMAVITELMDQTTAKPMIGQRLQNYATSRELVHVSIDEIIEYQQRVQ